MIRTDTAMPPNATMRELVAIFPAMDCLEAAIDDLAAAGFDRADMSLLGHDHVVSGDPARLHDSSETADDPQAPRRAVISDSDVRQGRTLATSLAGVIAAFVASGATILTGGGALAAVVGAAVAGGGASALVNTLGRVAGGSRDSFLQEQIEHGGIVLWVALRDPGHEDEARTILQHHGAHDIHVHEAPG